MKVDYRNDGSIASMVRRDGDCIGFRNDLYRGPAFWIWSASEAGEPVALQPDSHGAFSGCSQDVAFSLMYSLADAEDALFIDIQLHNQGDKVFAPQRCELRLGIDTFMVSYPDWNSIYFPTQMRCEKTHAWGYMMTPERKVLVLASKDPLASWHHVYARADYQRPQGILDPGHRIYTTSLDLLQQGRLPARHPQDRAVLAPGDGYRFRIMLNAVAAEEDIESTVKAFTGAPLITLNRYTFEPGTTAVCQSEGEVVFTAPSGKTIAGNTEKGFDEVGVWQVHACYQDKQAQACLHVRKPWSFYLEQAREAAIRYPQKASTHTESWYGFFSAFLAARHMPSPEKDKRLEAAFETVFQAMHDEHGLPVEAAVPGRIQNSAMMISVLTDAYEATDRLLYLERAAVLADHIIAHQQPDGAYRSGEGVHYTCVIYVAKAMLELYLAERKIGSGLWSQRAEQHFQSAKRAIDELRRSLDNIQTEGEMTFEDGMISCSSLQLGMLALLLPPEERQPFTDAAVAMLAKHRCLEMNHIPDGRMRGATLRFWETMYDVMTPQNMMTSPHGWTSWKIYAQHYLYLLTGDFQYLSDMIDTLGACMQVVDDQEPGKLHWAFIVDPHVEADRFLPDPRNPGRGIMQKDIVGEQYLDMISDWWQAEPGKVCKGYAFPYAGIAEGEFQGGACDNDVHEHFKCLEEVALTKTYVHQHVDGHYACFNGKARTENGHLVITPDEDCVLEVIVWLTSQTALVVDAWSSDIHQGRAGLNIINRQGLSHDYVQPSRRVEA